MGKPPEEYSNCIGFQSRTLLETHINEQVDPSAQAKIELEQQKEAEAASSEVKTEPAKVGPKAITSETTETSTKAPADSDPLNLEGSISAKQALANQVAAQKAAELEALQQTMECHFQKFSCRQYLGMAWSFWHRNPVALQLCFLPWNHCCSMW